tara:strand:+ start:423 stop:641 length:219 start_codon:yes stop_codon:yes gene_type:complete
MYARNVEIIKVTDKKSKKGPVLNGASENGPMSIKRFTKDSPTMKVIARPVNEQYKIKKLLLVEMFFVVSRQI